MDWIGRECTAPRMGKNWYLRTEQVDGHSNQIGRAEGMGKQNLTAEGNNEAVEYQTTCNFNRNQMNYSQTQSPSTSSSSQVFPT